MIRKYSVMFSVLSIMVFFVGCTQYPNRLEKDYGNSYSFARENQTLNPEAEKNLEPVYGFDGQAAERTIGRYRKSFEKAVPPPIYTNVVTSGSMGSSGK